MILYVSVDYNESPTKIRVVEENGRYREIKNLITEEISADTFAINLYYWDCVGHFTAAKQNDTIIDAPPSLDSCFNLIVRTYMDTNSVNEQCHQRDFYTLMDSVFLSKCDTLYDFLSTNSYKINKLDIVLYPNPVSTRLFVDSPNSVNTLNYSIYNTQGKQLLNGKLEESIDVSMLKNGMYIIRFEGQNGGITKRFIVE
jgi:hypothetical protein